MCFPNRLSSTRILSLTIQATKRTPFESRLSAIEVLVGTGVCRLELRDATTLRSGAPAIFRVQACDERMLYLWSEVFDIQKLVRNCP